MTRRRAHRTPSRDWRALASDAPQYPSRRHEGTDGARALEPDADAVELRLRRDERGARVTLVAAAVCTAPEPLRRLAVRMLAAADALERRIGER